MEFGPVRIERSLAEIAEQIDKLSGQAGALRAIVI
jgi:hypothetical protein